VEYICIDIAIDGGTTQELFIEQRPNDIGSSLISPSFLPKTALPLWAVTIRARHIIGKTTLVNVNNRAVIVLVGLYSCDKASLGFFIGLGVDICLFL